MILSPKTTAFIFPGQGSQTVGMGRELVFKYPFARQTFEEAEDILGLAISSIMWDGPKDNLDDTINTQPALYIHSVAAQRVFSHLYPDFFPAFVAGHSLGEITALTAASALPFAEGLRLVRMRGELMKNAGKIAPGGMAAILGLDISILDRVCAKASMDDELVQVANDNCPGQVVISGAKAAIDRAIAGAKTAGAKRGIPLAVSIAAHSPLMDSIQKEWNQAVDKCAIIDAKFPVIGNVSAQAMTSAEDLRNDLKAQMQARVRWTESIQNLLKSGTQVFVEMGSGSVLSGLIRRIKTDVSCIQLGNPSDFTNLQDESGKIIQ